LINHVVRKAGHFLQRDTLHNLVRLLVKRHFLRTFKNTLAHIFGNSLQFNS
jgi:hypothetical protein